MKNRHKYLFFLLCSFTHFLQLLISITAQLPRGHCLQRLKMKTSTHKLNIIMLLKKGKLIPVVFMAYFTVYLKPHQGSSGPPLPPKRPCLTDDEKCLKTGVAVGYYFAGSCCIMESSQGVVAPDRSRSLLHCQSSFWSGRGQERGALCCQAVPSAGTVPPTALTLVRSLGLP